MHHPPPPPPPACFLTNSTVCLPRFLLARTRPSPDLSALSTLLVPLSLSLSSLFNFQPFQKLAGGALHQTRLHHQVKIPLQYCVYYFGPAFASIYCTCSAFSKRILYIFACTFIPLWHIYTKGKINNYFSFYWKWKKCCDCYSIFILLPLSSHGI